MRSERSIGESREADQNERSGRKREFASSDLGRQMRDRTARGIWSDVDMASMQGADTFCSF
jgi:hypothetical protein